MAYTIKETGDNKWLKIQINEYDNNHYFLFIENNEKGSSGSIWNRIAEEADLYEKARNAVAEFLFCKRSDEELKTEKGVEKILWELLNSDRENIDQKIRLARKAIIEKLTTKD